MKKILLLCIIYVGCNKPNNSTTTNPTQPVNVDTIKAVDYSKFVSVGNATAYSSSIDSISISDTVYHPFHTDSLFYVNFGSSIWFNKTNYYDIPTRENVPVKMYLTVGNFYTPIEVIIFRPDGSPLVSTEVLKFAGKDSATFKMNVSNKLQITLSHI